MKKKSKVFFKVFAYTLFLVLLVSLSGVFLFSREILEFYQAEQRRLLSASFEPIISIIADRNNSPDYIAAAARVFADNNQAFDFRISTNDAVIFSTSDIDYLSNIENSLHLKFADSTRERVHDSFATIVQGPLGVSGLGFINSRGESLNILTEYSTGNVFSFSGSIVDSGRVDYNNLARRLIWAVVIMLAIALLGAFLFAWNVTKPLEDEIIRERAMEENQRLFFSAASHELKTPIAAARALVEGMIAGVGDYSDHQKYLRECISTLDSQAHLVSEILDIVKLSEKETEPSNLSFDLGELGNTILGEYRPLAELKGLTIQGEFPAVSLRTDRALLQKVLSNVIANAVQNTPQGEIIRIESERRKNLRLSIINTGVQIPTETLSVLFEPFFRQDAARTRGSQSGLGLTIVKKALDRMKCPFALENFGEGVVFWVELPVE